MANPALGSLLPASLSCTYVRMRRWSGERWSDITTILNHTAWNYNTLGYIPIEFTLIVSPLWAPGCCWGCDGSDI